ncbi:MAG: F0F1 ATP synthase subunit alpha [Candidatus Omnitrophica bacterium]|nr:F0F1 ATP synthase subunit alpha [Candidatus Omnitrophota bacterium]
MDRTTSRTQFEIREIGCVKSIREFIVKAVDMPSCITGQMVKFANGVRGLVMGFTENEVQILVLDSKSDIRAGDEVYSTGEPLLLPAGENFIGRMVDALAVPQDELGPIESDDYFSVFRDAPSVMQRIPVEKTLETGTVILDALIPIAKGQRQLLIGDRLTGKTTVAIDAILNQKGKNVICIYCCIGKPYSSLLRTLDLLREQGAMDYTIVVSGVASTSAGEQYLSPYTACMLGEYFMHSGRDVFVIFDDLTKHAWVYRQISLLLERAPGREAYPGDIFYIHSQLMERAGYLSPEASGGSMTFFPIVDILQGDVTGYVSSNLVSMTDGQVYFDASLFYKGFKPAIDLGLSVSRIGSKAQWNAMRDVSTSLRIEYLQYLELLQITQLHAGSLSKEAQACYNRNQIVAALIVQDKNKPIPVEEQITVLYLLNKGSLDDLAEDGIVKFKEKFFEFFKTKAQAVIDKLCETEELSEEFKTKLEEVFKEYIQGGSS